MAAGPNALRGSGPNPNLAFEDALTLAGSPDPRNDRVCITSSCPRQFLMTFCLLSAAMPAATSDLVASHPCDLVSKRNGSDDGHAAMLFIKARFIVLGRSPIAALYH